jgi:hypothetical protein
MIKNIFDFVNKNIVYITIVICLLAMWMIYTEDIKEHLTISDIKSENFSEIVKQGKKINFRCTIDGVNYYLAQLPISECEKKLNIDCYNSVIVLIPEDIIKSQLDTYFKTIKSNVDICNAISKVKCLNKLEKPTQNEIDECSTPLKKCNVNRFFIHDFNVTDVTNITSDTDVKTRKYLFKGTCTPDTDNSTTPTMLNQHLVYNKAIPTLCGDTYAYNGGSPKEHAEVIVSERVINNTGIIGGESPIKVQLLFNTQSVVVGKDPNTGEPKYMPWPANNPRKEYTYVGICKDTDTETYLCKNGNFTYKRVCLITANDKSIDEKRVLEFDPIIVN